MINNQKKLPSGWKKVCLNDYLNNSPVYGINAPAVDYSDKLPNYLRITDISSDGKFLSKDKKSVADINAKSFLLNVGDIVLARTGASVGKSYYYDGKDGELVFAGFLIKLSPNNHILSSIFLKHFFYSQLFWKWVLITSTRSGQPGINAKEYSNMPLFLPPLKEQKQITKILETWDTYLGNLNKLIKLKKNVKKGLMQQLLTGDVKLEGFSEEWREVKLGNVTQITMGQSPISSAYNKNRKGLPLIQGNNDIKNYSTIERIWTTQITKVAEKNSIIMTVRAPVGCIGIAKQKVCIGRGVCAINPIKIDFNFTYKLLQHYEQRWRLLEQGSTFKAVNSSDIKFFNMFIPTSLKEQTAIANILTTADKEIETLEKKRSLILEQKKFLLNNLITGNIRLPEFRK